jgi:arylsulfatase A-like enzyme
MINFLDMHEGTHEVINYLDEPLAKFLREMKAENTTIVMFSDHGPHMGGLLKAIGGT